MTVRCGCIGHVWTVVSFRNIQRPSVPSETVAWSHAKVFAEFEEHLLPEECDAFPPWSLSCTRHHFGFLNWTTGSYSAGFSFEVGGRTYLPVVSHSTSGTLISIFGSFNSSPAWETLETAFLSVLFEKFTGGPRCLRLRREYKFKVRCFHNRVCYSTKLV